MCMIQVNTAAAGDYQGELIQIVFDGNKKDPGFTVVKVSGERSCESSIFNKFFCKLYLCFHGLPFFRKG